MVSNILLLAISINLSLPFSLPLSNNNPYVQLSLSDTFQNDRLGDLFSSSAEFRETLRLAARKDLFVQPPLTQSDQREKYDKRVLLMKRLQIDLKSTANGNWRTCGECKHLTRAFQDHGIHDLSGEYFIKTLGKILLDSGSVINGSWLDISTDYQKAQSYAWHRDSSDDRQNTLMLGFPKEDDFSGEGVFSHLSLFDSSSEENAAAAFNQPVVASPQLNEKLSSSLEEIVKPVWKKGGEILLYRDTVYHSAPDITCRASVWRLM